MDADLEEIVGQARQKIAAVAEEPQLADVKASFLGKTGALTALMKSLAGLSGEAKAKRGQALNQSKQQVEALLNQRHAELREALLQQKLAAERIEAIFRSIGFDVADGPEIEQDFYNFTALNMPSDHPARSMHDTFYVAAPAEAGERAEPLVLRTHTSPMQIRYARSHPPPIKVIAPGKTYRVDSDATHSPMFHQFEGMWIDEDVSFADLKSVYADFLHQFFERDDIDVRFRPSYFPFTEPSAEIDMRFGEGPLKGRWLEVSGSGQVHPNVVRNIGLDPERYIGFAFGSGVERLAMLRYGVDDLRLFFENDLRFLRQFA